jgi:hypothetical protein
MTGSRAQTRRHRARRLGAGATVTVMTMGSGGCAVQQALDGSGAQHHESQSHTYLHAIDRMVANVDGGDITFIGGPGRQVTVAAALTWTSIRPAVTEQWNGNTLQITTHCPDQRDCNTDITVRLPAGVGVSADTGGGSIITQQMAGAQQLSTGGGGVQVSSPRGPLTVETGGGTVTGSLLNSAQTTVTTSGGDVTLGYAAAPSRVTVRSSGGDIDVAVPHAGSGTDGYRVQATTSGGTTSIGVTQDSAGSRAITLATDGGDVQVRYG